jgi:NADH:ubiquinone oxidoreductase subunit 2 (subunit N)
MRLAETADHPGPLTVSTATSTLLVAGFAVKIGLVPLHV